MRTKTFQELFQKVYGKIEDETYQEIADAIFTLAKEKHMSLYDAFRQMMWYEGHDIWLHISKKYKEIKRKELMHLSMKIRNVRKGSSTWMMKCTYIPR